MSEWKEYRRKNTTFMRDLDAQETPITLEMEGVSVSPHDHELPEDIFLAGKVARNPMVAEDMWYVNKTYFDENFEPVEK
jgi:hypothetical protein